MSGQDDHDDQRDDGADSTKSEQYHTGDIVQTDLLILIMGSGVRVRIWIAGIQPSNNIIIIIAVKIISLQLGGDVFRDVF